MNHSVLLDKLRCYGIRKVRLWLQFFLLYLNGLKVIAYEQPLYLGVQQGSVLGPVLFLFLVNNIIVHFSSILSISVFADDTNFTIKSKGIWWDLRDLISMVIQNINSYVVENDLSLKKDKTEWMVWINRREPNFSLFIRTNHVSLQQRYFTKYLGVLLDYHLSWKYHITTIMNKLSSKCLILWRLRKFVKLNVLKTLNFVHVHSGLN